ncbi:MAG: hypothetical protein WDM85_10750 [Caulobacteraceae bacterium]
MRAIQLGPIVGVDVGRGRSIEAEDILPPPSLWRWLISGDCGADRRSSRC